MSPQKKSKLPYIFEPDFAVPPGETLSEVIESLSMTKKELAKRSGLTEQTIIRVIKGDQPITFETALKLEMVTGVKARFWNNLEMNYREQLSRIKQNREMGLGEKWLKNIPLVELKARDILPQTNDSASLVRESLRFYGVAGVDAWKKMWDDPNVPAGRSDYSDLHLGSFSAWIRVGEHNAKEIVCEPFDVDRFRQVLSHLRGMTTLSQGIFLDEMRTVCADVGVALSFTRPFKDVPYRGAVKWLSSNKVLILLTLREMSEEEFWLTYFRAAYHVLHGGKKRLYIIDGDCKDSEEQKAERFAENLLIPHKYDALIAELATVTELTDLASRWAISPGIVAQRYRSITKNWSHFKDLTKMYTFEQVLDH
jgi:addiction module HigA family antidote